MANTNDVLCSRWCVQLCAEPLLMPSCVCAACDTWRVRCVWFASFGEVLDVLDGLSHPFSEGTEPA